LKKSSAAILRLLVCTVAPRRTPHASRGRIVIRE
jgi:hypothetical protein